MPAKDPQTRSGWRSISMTDNYLAVMDYLRKSKSAKQTAERFGTTRQSIAGIVRSVEKKMHTKLFHRKQGRLNDEWTPINPDQWGRLVSWKFVNRRTKARGE